MGFFGSSTRGATGFATGATAFGASCFAGGFEAIGAGFAAGAAGITFETTGFTATFAGAAAFTGALAGVLAAVLDTTGFTALEAMVFEAVLDVEFFEPAALGATFAVLWGIALLFLEDATAVPALRVSLVDARVRLFVALRRAAAAFFKTFEDFDVFFKARDFEAEDFDFEDLDSLFLRVFWATTNRAEPPRPC